MKKEIQFIRLQFARVETGAAFGQGKRFRLKCSISPARHLPGAACSARMTKQTGKKRMGGISKAGLLIDVLGGMNAQSHREILRNCGVSGGNLVASMKFTSRPNRGWAANTHPCGSLWGDGFLAVKHNHHGTIVGKRHIGPFFQETAGVLHPAL